MTTQVLRFLSLALVGGSWLHTTGSGNTEYAFEQGSEARLACRTMQGAAGSSTEVVVRLLPDLRGVQLGLRFAKTDHDSATSDVAVHVSALRHALTATCSGRSAVSVEIGGAWTLDTVLVSHRGARLLRIVGHHGEPLAEWSTSVGSEEVFCHVDPRGQEAKVECP